MASDKKLAVKETLFNSAVVSDKVKDRGNDPFFIKKAEKAKEFLQKHPFPDHLKK